MACIRPLPESVRSSVRSGIFLFDSTRVVEELVFNSLDAGARKVSVFVNIGSCYVKVVDDGGGIARDGLELVGQRYATSKFLNLDDLNATSRNFGFRGEALASISELSLLEIVTKAHGRPNGYRKVLKGCKCLYLGIDDDRKEVGTTVIVRDLFYNQPVRRKYMQSSPNKVLQSIKKCVQRLALVRPSISFKVVDVEREDELFCTQSAPSPLSLLTSGFGEEVSSSLQALEVENDIIKLSGYVSSTYNALNMKGLQYVYINSQFVCNGPIHKLLSQMAISFEHLNPRNTENEFLNKKGSRSQPCPAYILNLSCPRSFYDLTFEPSKTYVQFKDWAPILNFIEKAIKKFWKESIACVESFNQATYVAQEDQVQQDEPQKADINILSTEADKSKFGYQTSKDCLKFTTSDKLTEDEYFKSDGEDVRKSLGYLHRATEIFKEKQHFPCQTGFSGSLLDGSYSKSMSAVMRKHNTSSIYYDNGQLLGGHFLDSEFPAAESLHDDVLFDAPSSSHGRKFLEVDADMINEFVEGDLQYNNHGFCYDVEVNGDFQKPFLKSCSVRESILDEKGLFLNDEHEIQTDSFWSEQNLGEDGGSVKDLSAQHCPEVVSKFKMSRGPDFFFKPVAEDLPYYSYSSTQTINSGSDDLLLNSERHPVYREPSSPAPAWRVNCTSDTNDTNDLGGVCHVSRYNKRVHHTEFLNDEENEGDFNYNISGNANHHHHTSSFDNDGFEFNDAVYSEKIFDTIVDWQDCGYKHSTKRSDVLTGESEMLLPDRSVEKSKRPNSNKDLEDHFGNPALENSQKRSERSFSAPPFHKHKRRFISLNQPSEMAAKRFTGQPSNLAFNHREAGDFKYTQQSPGDPQPTTEDVLLNKFKTNVKQRSDVLGDTHVLDKRSDGFCTFNIENNAPFRELFLREVQDSIDQRTKWRDCSPQIPKNDKLIDFQSQNNILDISSGFLHLAGDSLIPETISKKCLEDAKVLHQVDKKFIPVVAGGTLAVIDQHIALAGAKKGDSLVCHEEDPTLARHAADERIRLEELRQKVLSGEAKEITYLDAEQELVLPEIGYQLLHSYGEQVKDWGWICNIHDQNSKSFKRSLDILNRQPVAVTLIAVPRILGVNLNDDDLLEFLQQLADTDGSSTMPPSVIRVLNLKACRGAIMFGDPLLPSECSLLVEELKHTSLCFQCAHGRPTTVPLVNLEALHNQIAKLALMNGGSDDDNWHGLHRHQICFERAAHRLSSATGS